MKRPAFSARTTRRPLARLAGLKPLSRLAGLGDYFDGVHTWHYDPSINGYVNESGAPSQPAAPAAPAPTVQTTFGPTTDNLLYQAVTGEGIDGSTQHINSNFYATLQAAQQFAAALGGSVVVDPTSANFSTSVPMYAIKLPNGATVNAGALAQILDNDAAYGNLNVKSGAIADLLGAEYKPGIAEALATGTRVQLTPADAIAPGYSVPLWTSTGGSSSTASPAATAARVEFKNLTNPAAVNAAQADRDHWRITITGAAPRSAVTITARKNAGADSTSNLGSTDDAGNFALEGVTTAADAGTWYETFKVAGATVGTLTVQITAPGVTASGSSSPAPPAATAARVEFKNLTNPAAANAAEADRDHWRIAITGAAPRSAVSLTARKNGGADSTSNLGTTDDAGNFALEGMSTAADAGTWYETFKVAGAQVGTLTVKITAPGVTAPTSSTSSTTSSGETSPTPAGFNLPASLSAVPWYVWAIGAGGLLLFRGRR